MTDQKIRERRRAMTTITQNVIVCPHCENAFVHNKINGVALVQLASDIEARKRMYIRLMLNAIERLDNGKELSVDSVRKIILDNTNELVRDIHTNIGFGVDAE